MVATLEHFGSFPDGREVRCIHLRAGRLEARVLTHGARLAMLRLDDGPNLCLSSADVADLEGPLQYAGPVIAPVINRIRGASAEIDGRRFRFEANEGANTLHSGPSGAHRELWDIEEHGSRSAVLSVHLADGAGGFPGNRVIRAEYRLAEQSLHVVLSATTDATTLMNPGLHGYWNLDGAGAKATQLLEIPAERYLPTREDKIPLGREASVNGTPFDHRTPRQPDPTLDHNYCFDAPGLRARLVGTSACALEIHSDAPGIQVYAGDPRGLALEPQYWPDAPHHPSFPRITLRPGETFRQVSEYRFVPL